MIRIDSIWLATEPMDMRAGTESALARVVAVFGAAPASRQVLLAGNSTRLSDGVRCRTTACPGAGSALAKSWVRQRDFHHIRGAYRIRKKSYAKVF
jgi:transposase